MNYYIPYNLRKLGEQKINTNKTDSGLFILFLSETQIAYKGFINFTPRYELWKGMQTRLPFLLMNVNSQQYFVME